jgi:hypothetical protein
MNPETSRVLTAAPPLVGCCFDDSADCHELPSGYLLARETRPEARLDDEAEVSFACTVRVLSVEAAEIA